MATHIIIDQWGQMSIDADILAKDRLWRKNHAGAIHQPHKVIYGAIQPTTME